MEICRERNGGQGYDNEANGTPRLAPVHPAFTPNVIARAIYALRLLRTRCLSPAN